MGAWLGTFGKICLLLSLGSLFHPGMFGACGLAGSCVGTGHRSVLTLRIHGVWRGDGAEAGAAEEADAAVGTDEAEAAVEAEADSLSGSLHSPSSRSWSDNKA